MLDGRYFHEYPYTDFHELNTDWIINEELEIRKRIEDYLKKIDDLLRKQADLDKKVGDVANHVNDVENEVNNKIGDITKHIDDAENRINKKIDDTTKHVDDAENRINKKIDDANKHVDDVEKKVNDIQPKIDEQNQKINDIDNKNNENQAKINDSVRSVTYENVVNTGDSGIKLIGRIHVEKPDTGDTVTPVYGYMGGSGGALGNCVVWSSSPYVGIGEQKDYIMKNPKKATLMEFPISGSFLAVCGGNMLMITDGSLKGDGVFFDHDNQSYLITPDSLVGQWVQTSQDSDTRIMTPKVASGIKYEDAKYKMEAPGDSGKPVTLTLPCSNDHLYVITVDGYRGYIINGTLTTVHGNVYITAKVENNTFTCSRTGELYDTVTLMFLDLGSMV